MCILAYLWTLQLNCVRCFLCGVGIILEMWVLGILVEVVGFGIGLCYLVVFWRICWILV